MEEKNFPFIRIMDDCPNFHQQMELKPLSTCLNIEYCDAVKDNRFFSFNRG